VRDKPKKLFIECTYTHLSELNTGIQRVVRKLVAHLPKVADDYGFTIHPVILSNDRFIEIEALNSVEFNQTRNKKQLLLRTLRHTYQVSRKGIATLLPHPKVKRFLFAHRNEFGLNYLLDQTIIRSILKAKSLIKASEVIQEEGRPPVNASKGDILLLLDSSWHMDIWQAVAEMRTQGVQPLTIAYDLIPILHPQFLNESLVCVFKNWFQQAAHHCDGFIAISKTVQGEIKQQLAKIPEINPSEKFTTHFSLGADFFNTGITPNRVRTQLKNIFERTSKKHTNIYLSVGTIEPRKNHHYLLDAFDRLWDQGLQIQLCLVGKYGWQYSNILSRIKSHKFYAKYLFLWNDLNDSELAYCYQHSSTLLFASYAEGFGLPIIEGLHYGLQVLASDIPVHREVGGTGVDYFRLDNPEELAQKIEQIETTGQPVKQKAPYKACQLLTWEQSARSLMHEIVNFTQRHPQKISPATGGQKTGNQGTSPSAQIH